MEGEKEGTDAEFDEVKESWSTAASTRKSAKEEIADGEPPHVTLGYTGGKLAEYVKENNSKGKGTTRSVVLAELDTYMHLVGYGQNVKRTPTATLVTYFAVPGAFDRRLRELKLMKKPPVRNLAQKDEQSNKNSYGILSEGLIINSGEKKDESTDRKGSKSENELGNKKGGTKIGEAKGNRKVDGEVIKGKQGEASATLDKKIKGGKEGKEGAEEKEMTVSDTVKGTENKVKEKLEKELEQVAQNLAKEREIEYDMPSEDAARMVLAGESKQSDKRRAGNDGERYQAQKGRNATSSTLMRSTTGESLALYRLQTKTNIGKASIKSVSPAAEAGKPMQ